MFINTKYCERYWIELFFFSNKSDKLDEASHDREAILNLLQLESS